MSSITTMNCHMKTLFTGFLTHPSLIGHGLIILRQGLKIGQG